VDNSPHRDGQSAPPLTASSMFYIVTVASPNFTESMNTEILNR